MMVKEIERAGIDVVHVANMTAVSKSIGANRILKAYSIPAAMADLNATPAIQRQQRYNLMSRALEILNTDIKEQPVFE